MGMRGGGGANKRQRIYVCDLKTTTGAKKLEELRGDEEKEPQARLFNCLCRDPHNVTKH
jgi:hypothetical protein